MAFTGNQDARFNIRATDRTKAAFDSVKSNMAGLRAGVIGVRAAVGLLVGSAGLGLMVRQTVESADKIQKLSISLGASTEAFSQYRLVAERSGTTLDSLALIWQRQTRRIAEAANGTGEARDALRELGLESTELAKLSPDRQFEVIADAMQKVENQSDRLRLAFKLFDSEGARPALQAMAGGSEALREMRAEADAMGLTLTRVQADQMAEFNDRMGDLRLASQGLSQQITISLGPNLIELAESALKAGFAFAKLFDSMKDVENRTNLEGLQEDLTRVQIAANNVGAQIDLAINEGRDTSVLEHHLGNLRKESDAIIERMKTLQGESQKALNFGGTDVDPFGGSGLTIAEENAAKREAAKLAKLQENKERELEVIRQSLLTQDEIEEEAYQRRQEILIARREEGMLSDQEFRDLEARNEQQHAERLALIRMTAEKKVSSEVLKLRGDVANKTIGILQALGGQSKAFAAAAIVLESVIAAKKIIIESQVAAMAALTPPPVGLGPVAGQALAAQIIGLGQVSAGLTLATGALQLGSLGGGGGGNFAATGTFNADPNTGLPIGSQQQQQPSTEVTIILPSSAALLTVESVRGLIDQINEQIDDGVNVGSIRIA